MLTKNNPPKKIQNKNKTKNNLVVKNMYLFSKTHFIVSPSYEYTENRRLNTTLLNSQTWDMCQQCRKKNMMKQKRIKHDVFCS